ncbi:MAG: hypothetical protein K2H85_00520 [Allobaculum sp.]|nr:hypothetical protein [Allobaculum sp.]
MKNTKGIYLSVLCSAALVAGCSSSKGVSSTCTATFQGIKTQIVLQAEKEDATVDSLRYIETVPIRDLLEYGETEDDLQDEIQDEMEEYQENYGVSQSAISYQVGDQDVTFTIQLSVEEFIGSQDPVYFDYLIDGLEGQGYSCD